MTEPRSFDPGAACPPDSGIFGLPFDVDEAQVVVLPVPWAPTTSYGGGAERGPGAVLAASRQVDLYDRETGRPYEAGIAMEEIPAEVLEWHRRARADARAVIAAAGEVGGDPALAAALGRVNALSERLDEWVFERTRELLEGGHLVALLGGDHSAPFGSICAHAEAYPGMGILHVDAHADLRPAFEGFAGSHASIMHNVSTRLPGVDRVVQVGIRDFSEEESRVIEESGGRIVTFFDADLAAARHDGVPWRRQVEGIVESLPERVYVSFDIDGLDPSLCPHTGTPVPGGLSFHEANALLAAVARSGRRIVGLDLCEVVPGEGGEWDANVGARVLYKLIGWMLVSRGMAATGR